MFSPLTFVGLCALFLNAANATVEFPEKISAINTVGSVAERSVLIRNLPAEQPAIREVIALLRVLGVEKLALASLARIGDNPMGPYVCVFLSSESAQRAVQNQERLREDELFGGVSVFPFHEDGEQQRIPIDDPVGAGIALGAAEFAQACVDVQFSVDAEVGELVKEAGAEQEANGAHPYCITLRTFFHLEAHVHHDGDHIDEVAHTHFLGESHHPVGVKAEKEESDQKPSRAHRLVHEISLNEKSGEAGHPSPKAGAGHQGSPKKPEAEHQKSPKKPETAADHSKSPKPEAKQPDHPKSPKPAADTHHKAHTSPKKPADEKSHKHKA